MSLATLIARTFVRYLVPLAVIAAIVVGPIVLLAHHVVTPANPAQARLVLRAGWLFAASGLGAMLLLVGGVAPAVRAIASGTQRSQVAILGAGVAGLVRALLPAAFVIAAVAMGLLALVIPGVVLFALFALVPASEAHGVVAKAADSARVVRANLPSIAVVLALVIAALVGAMVVQQLALPIPLGKKPTLAELVTFPALVRLLSWVIAAVAPLGAIVLAGISVRGQRT